MFAGHDGIRDAYRDEGVASRYIDERFREPLGALLHQRQSAALRRALDARQPCRVLEIAPGPGRLTTEVADLPGVTGTVLDASAQMLAQACRRVEPLAGGRWTFVHGDAFHLPFDAPFDALFVFRLVRHFGSEERLRLYREFARVLKPGGLLVFDAINETAFAELRRRNADQHMVFDATLTRDALRGELEAGGFRLDGLEGVQRRFLALYRLQVLVAPRSRWLARAAMEVLERTPGGDPLEWIVTCRRA